jgi:Fungal specific transcription factor domain
VFFQSIQPHYPLFRKSTFLGKHHAGQVQESLLSAMLAVSIANSTNIDIAGLGFSNVSETYAFHAWQACSEIVIYGSPATMDDLKTLFLLGLYEFRNSPNRKAWNVTGHLVRQAYHYGLHQVESPGGCGFLGRKTNESLEQEELRYFWWSLYILDTCCNLTIATPSSIDLDMVNTYLPSGNVERWTSGYSPPIETQPMSLSADIQGLSELVTRVSHSRFKNVGPLSSYDGNYDTNFLIRIITTSILRELSNVRQIAAHSSALRAQQRWQTQSNLFAALQLALPAGYLDPRRDLPSGESGYNHTLRLVSVIEINLARFWQQLPKPYDQVGSRAWLIDWCAALETAERIVDVIKQWDTGFIYLADPAISYIIFVSMVLIQTDKRLDRQAIGLAVTGERSQDSWQLLKMFLQRLSSHWLLSKALLAAAENFRSAASSPLSLADAAEILKNFQKPLTFRKDRNQGENGQSETMQNASFDQSNQDDMFWAYNLNPNILPDWFDLGNMDSFQL